ncbi:phosphatase PAP2 family protein [Fuscovulum blasticum]|uniref:phosphatase PAP2 family protein n=1 Tax=Fuscovulum blasticum TaxID=1075 RepID=UPI000D3ECA90|nr:phosphatase PAP2 family protein [Fuscovulum blasticum]AWD22749.1 hypothetical protein B6K69_14570 [Fuscovulum blasticum]
MHPPDLARPGHASRIRPLLRQTLLQHRLLAILIAIYATISLSLDLAFGQQMASEKVSTLWMNFLEMLPKMAYFLLMWRLLVQRFVVPPEQRRGWLKDDLRRAITDPERLVPGFFALLLMVVALVSFAQLKRLIPVIQPFSWDKTFIALDRTLHFGLDPWQIAHAVAGNPLVVTLITGAYNFWMFLLYFSLIFACFSTAHRAARMRYLIAFLLTWAIGGNLIATVFSSAGPVFVQRLGLGDHFAPLMALLHSHVSTQPLTVIQTQDLLWSFYAAPVSLNGISAFPSMHVASTVLMALYARAYNRRFGQVMAVFAGIIMLGSVLLAWHYAVDGYAGAAIGVACWWLAGRLQRRSDEAATAS